MTFRERLEQIDEEHKINAALAGIEKETAGAAAEPPTPPCAEEGVTVHCTECGSNTFREEHSAIMCSNCGHGPFCNYCWNRHIREFHPLLLKPYDDARRGIRTRAQFLNHYLIRTVVKPAGFVLAVAAMLFVAYYSYLSRNADSPAETAGPAPAETAADATPRALPATGQPLAEAAGTPGAVAASARRGGPAGAPEAEVGGAAPLMGDAPLELVAMTSPVPRSTTASLTIQTAAAAGCVIQVRYRSGPSRAGGLEPKTADSNGRITWSWRVGSQTALGEWPVEVACESGSQRAQLSAILTVTK